MVVGVSQASTDAGSFVLSDTSRLEQASHSTSRGHLKEFDPHTVSFDQQLTVNNKQVELRQNQCLTFAAAMDHIMESASSIEEI
jgi:hypothetical protein